MSLTLVVLLAAVLVGALLGGSLTALGSLPLRRPGLVLAGVAVQLVAAFPSGPAGLYAAGLVVSALLVAMFLALNRQVAGLGLVAAGLTANALVVALNGAMPVSSDAAGRVGVSTQAIVRGDDPRHEPAGPGTVLPGLADVVPVALPLRPEVVSPGDVLVAAGVGRLVVVAMRGGAARRCARLDDRMDPEEDPMAKKGRKKRARKKSNANHGKRPNA